MLLPLPPPLSFPAVCTDVVCVGGWCYLALCSLWVCVFVCVCVRVCAQEEK